MTDSSKPRAVPRCLLIRGSYTGWRLRMSVRIAAALWGITLLAALVALIDRTSWRGFFAGNAGDIGIMAVLWILCLPVIYLVAQRHMARLRELRAKANVNADERIERVILEHQASGERDLPEGLPWNTPLEWPDAIFLALVDRRNWPTPQSTDVPFEPLPLGRDPLRVRELLQEFAGLEFTRRSDAASPRVLLRRYREWLVTLSPTRRAVVKVLPVVLFVWIPLLVFVSFSFPVGVPWMAAAFALTLAAQLTFSYFRHEGRSTERWLFPGVIGIRWGTQGVYAGKETVCRRGMGTLFYDAPRQRLSIPLGDGGYDHCHCEPHDGLIAVWAWLNTAQPPDNIHLDDIG